ncbi:MAG TPA: hypothetical protein VFE58_04220 [Tepidisphaeraceae bacterium]|jgi:anti-sigma factor RsiW|nr:hypothetical protein [Tepidisphaeraceae bacterium]
MTETDLDMLEMYLDDALSDRDLAEAARRIAEEPELATELALMRVQREMRREYFASIEPTEAGVERLLGRVDESLRRRSSWERQIKWGRIGIAAAACIAIGFTTGYVGRGTGRTGGPAVAQNQQVTAPTVVASNTDDHDHIHFVGKVTPQVQLTDDNGRVIAVQPFESMDKANEFVNDIQTWQDRQRQVQNGNVLLMGGKF